FAVVHPGSRTMEFEACPAARGSGAQRDAAQQRIAGVFIPVRTWPDRMVCSHGWPTGFLADPLGRRFELLDERSETRRHRLRYSVVLDPKPSSNCQQPRSLI